MNGASLISTATPKAAESSALWLTEHTAHLEGTNPKIYGRWDVAPSGYAEKQPIVKPQMSATQFQTAFDDAYTNKKYGLTSMSVYVINSVEYFSAVFSPHTSLCRVRFGLTLSTLTSEISSRAALGDYLD
ncbi:hypothetical protein HK097_002087 [Rhizophlyctis rosea]|uniref:Uncharacterized protein n=1 Tax=Rhizophlyctis rosea TaxID=64517 RepID=A0AAD5S3R8_9FUNG|nr:hypothetical protein HK097_002087 [Rhizophlyctis rosea]